MKKLILLIALTITGLIYAQNEPDKSVNLALTDDAFVFGSVNDGRGEPMDILFDPKKGNYHTGSELSEYGVDYREKIDGVFIWGVVWESPKLINYITIGGTYPNQPQPNTNWKISYELNGNEVIIEQGKGGWIDNGIYEWKSENLQPITADRIFVELSAPEGEQLNSIHLRARGGTNKRLNDDKTEPKATLIQLLPYEEIEVPENETALLKAILEMLTDEIVKMKVDLIAIKKQNEILQNRITNLHKE